MILCSDSSVPFGVKHLDSPVDISDVLRMSSNLLSEGLNKMKLLFVEVIFLPDIIVDVDWMYELTVFLLCQKKFVKFLFVDLNMSPLSEWYVSSSGLVEIVMISETNVVFLQVPSVLIQLKTECWADDLLDLMFIKRFYLVLVRSSCRGLFICIVFDHVFLSFIVSVWNAALFISLIAIWLGVSVMKLFMVVSSGISMVLLSLYLLSLYSTNIPPTVWALMLPSIPVIGIFLVGRGSSVLFARLIQSLYLRYFAFPV